MMSTLMAPILAAFVLYSPMQPVQHHVELSPIQTECITQAIYFESRSEGTTGSAAIAYVVLNRVAMEHKTPCQIIHERAQFSFYHPNRRLSIKEPSAWKQSANVAVATQLGIIKNPIGNATLYNTTPMRSWKHVVFVKKIKHEYFYQLRSTVHMRPLVIIPNTADVSTLQKSQNNVFETRAYTHWRYRKIRHRTSYIRKKHYDVTRLKYKIIEPNRRFFKRQMFEYCRDQIHTKPIVCRRGFKHE